ENQDFGNFELFDISGMKYEDLDGDGEVDDGEGAPDATFRIGLYVLEEGEEPVLLKWTDTAADGSYSFTDLGPLPEGQSYGVREIGYYDENDALVLIEADESDWLQTFGSDGSIAASSGNDTENQDFGNFELFDISGMKYEDLDGDGSIDDGEGAPDATFRIGLYVLEEGEAPVLLKWTDTAADGSYSFTDLGPLPEGQSYGVREIGYYDENDALVLIDADESDWWQTFGSDGSIAATSGNDTENQDFGNTKYASIEGYKFFDEDRDGTWDEDEQGALGWTIELYLDGDMNGNGILDEGEVADGILNGEAVMAIDVSGEDGSWSFDGLYLGTYFVKEVMKPGWLQTTPMLNGDGVFKVVVDESGEVVIEAVSADPSSYDELPNDGMLWFGNDMIDGPGVRTPGFWQSNLGQTYWDGDEDNDGIIPGTGNTEEKEGENFAENDVFWLNYEGNYKTENGEPVLQVGDWNFNTLEDDGGEIREYSLDEALAALQGGTSTKGKSSDYAKLSTVERSLVASWLNYMAGNPVDTPTDDGHDVAYWIDQAIMYLEYFEPTSKNTRKVGAEAWKTGLDYDGDGDIDESGAAIQAALDGWNNSGELDGYSVAFDGDNGSDITAQAYYDAVA
ncbi:hypothetical protein OE699_12990, partial [Sedimentimonas flavescens]